MDVTDDRPRALDEARRRWVEAHLKVAEAAAIHYASRFRIGFDAALSAANLGLCEAALTYDEAKGSPKTHIFFHIQRRIFTEIDSLNVIRRPFRYVSAGTRGRYDRSLRDAAERARRVTSLDACRPDRSGLWADLQARDEAPGSGPREEIDQVMAVVRSLPDQWRDVILAYAEGRSIRGWARDAGVNHGAARWAFNRGIAAIRRRLKVEQ